MLRNFDSLDTIIEIFKEADKTSPTFGIGSISTLTSLFAGVCVMPVLLMLSIKKIRLEMSNYGE